MIQTLIALVKSALTPTIDSITSDISRKVNALDKLANRHYDAADKVRAKQAELHRELEILEDEADDHFDEAARALNVARKFSSLLA